MSLVSIIIPVYNTEKYIKKCIESISSQTYSNIEIIIVNDGSTDSSPEILEDLAKRDSRIRLYHQENKGIGAARKLGLSKAVGEYFQFVDSDDWIEAECIQELYDCAQQYDADIVETAGMYRHNQNGELVWKSPIKYSCPIELKPDKVAKDIVQRLHSCSLCTKFFKKEFCTKNGIDFVKGIDFGEDAHFICKACYFHPKYILLNKVFYHNIDNPTSTTKTKYKRKNFDCRIKLINNLYDFYDREDFRMALNSMKFFIKEESAISGFISKEEYEKIFPETKLILKDANAGFLRKLFVWLEIKHYNPIINKIRSSKICSFIIRFDDRIYRRLRCNEI